MSICKKCSKVAPKFACCDKCNNLLCKTCASLQETEWRCVTLTKRKLKFFCEYCDENPNDNDLYNMPEQSVNGEGQETELDDVNDHIRKHLQKENKLLSNTIVDKNMIITDKEKLIMVLEERVMDLKQKLKKDEEKSAEGDHQIKCNKTKETLENTNSPEENNTEQKINYAEALRNENQSSSISGIVKTKTSKKKRKNTTTESKSTEKMYGKGQLNDLIVAAPERNWIWLGGLNESITLENVQQYVKLKFPEKNVSCYDLKSKFRKKCFKVGSSEIPLEDLLDPEIWPAKVILRPFQQRPSENQHKTSTVHHG